MTIDLQPDSTQPPTTNGFTFGNPTAPTAPGAPDITAVEPQTTIEPPATFGTAALTDVTDRDFYRLMGSINVAHAIAAARLEDAEQNLAVLLTEQISRIITKEFPTAALLFVRVGADFHDADAHAGETCEGHNHRLVAFEVLDEEGLVLNEPIDTLHPMQYVLERLSPLLGLEEQVLDIAAREWALDCASV